MEDLAHETKEIEKKNLYGISNEYRTLIDSIMENEGEITEEQSQLLAINEKDLKSKSRNYIAVIKDREKAISIRNGEISFYKTQIEALEKRNKQDEAITTRLKETLKQAMLLYDIDEIDTTLNKIKFSKSSTMEIDMDLLPKKYQIIKQTISHMPKAELKKLNKENPIKGVTIIEHKNIQIK